MTQDQGAMFSDEPVVQVQLARFPRRLNAITTDALVLVSFSTLVFLLIPRGDEFPTLRLGLGILWWSVLFLYEPVMIARRGSTLGHQAFNLKVVDDRTGGNPGFAKALVRLPLKSLLGVFSFLSMSFSRRHQALHDMITSTTVQIRDPSRALPQHFVWGPGA